MRSIFQLSGLGLFRNSIEVDEARNMGATVRSVIEAIETEITRLAPRGFPNRLDSEFSPEDELEYLEQEITNLEKKISAAILSYSSDTGRNVSAEDWSAVLLASRASLQGELNFISNADFIVTRHFDFKRPLRLALLKQRLDYLHLLQQEVE